MTVEPYDLNQFNEHHIYTHTKTVSMDLNNKEKKKRGNLRRKIILADK